MKYINAYTMKPLTDYEGNPMDNAPTWRRRNVIPYVKRLSAYKASNVVFYPHCMTAFSYEWWQFLDKIGKKVVFNDYCYSPTTGRHQQKVKRMLDELGVKVDITIEAPAGLQDLHSAIRLYTQRIEELTAAMQKRGSKRIKNEERKGEISRYKALIKTVEKLQSVRNKG